MKRILLAAVVALLAAPILVLADASVRAGAPSSTVAFPPPCPCRIDLYP